jgi:uncharacterized protein (DUF983 family)
MAYVQCTRCGLTAFTVAYWSSTDYCGRCGAELPRPARGGDATATARTPPAPRRWRRFAARALQAVRRGRAKQPSHRLVGRCPGCGGLVWLPVGVAGRARCEHCQTPLIATADGLDVELAVQSRLYSAIAPVTVIDRRAQRKLPIEQRRSHAASGTTS